MEKLIVTKHPEIERYLKETGIVPADTPCVSYIGADYAMGKWIYGVVPLEVAANAYRYTEVKITFPRGIPVSDLPYEKVKSCIKYVKTFQVTEITD